MNYLKMLPAWGIVTIILLISAAFFKFCLRGYGYIAAALLFFAVLIVISKLAPVWLRRGVMALVLVGFAYFIYVEIPIIKNARTDADAGRKYLVVLGAAVHGDVPSLELTHRLEGALDYLEKYPDSVAIVSGGKGSGENISEAECMQSWLLAHGVSPERVIPEDKATSTAENLQNSFSIIRERGDEPDGNVAIVSSSYHLYRAKTMAKLMGVSAAGVAGNPGYPVYMLNCFIREAFGVTHLRVFGP